MSIFGPKKRNKTVLISIDQDTPTFRFGKSKTEDVPVTVDVETLARWRRVMAEFDSVQEEMNAAVTPSELNSRKPSTE